MKALSDAPSATVMMARWRCPNTKRRQLRPRLNSSRSPKKAVQTGKIASVKIPSRRSIFPGEDASPQVNEVVFLARATRICFVAVFLAGNPPLFEQAFECAVERAGAKDHAPGAECLYFFHDAIAVFWPRRETEQDI